MFFSLPDEIITHIYEYDSTYKELFDTVLEDIEQYQIYHFSRPSVYYIYNTHNNHNYIVDDLQNPTWISFSKNTSFQKLQRIKKEKVNFEIPNLVENELHFF